MIATNQLSTLNACLGCFFGHRERKIAMQCLDMLHELLCTRIKGTSPTNSAELEQIVNITTELIFLGQLAKKIRAGMESCVCEDGVTDEEFILKCLKYLYLLYTQAFAQALEKPMYDQPTLPCYFHINFEYLVQFLQNFLANLIYDRDGNLRDE